MAALGLTIPGAGGGTLVFSVKGESLGNEVTAFSAAVAGATVVEPTGSTIQGPRGGLGNVATATTINEIFSSSSSPTAYTIGGGGQYTAVLTSVPTTITGSTAGGDTLVAASNVTYDAVGGNNNIALMYGENVYNGGSASGDTVTGSEGSDTINTGTGATTVFSGYGTSNIVLNDTVTAGDFAFLGDGHALVTANGLNDTVWAAVSGQRIFGSDTVASSAKLTVIVASKTGNPGFTGNDFIVGGSAQLTVLDSIGGNTIFGGSGALTFVGEQRPSLVVANSIFAGTGGATVYGGDENSLTIGSAASDPVAHVFAGLGNETLNGAFADGGVNFFLANSTGQATAPNPAINDTAIGGNGANYFSTGSGNKSLVAGAGTNWFDINLGGPSAQITISDFAQNNNNIINLVGENSAQIAAAEQTAHLNSNGNLQLTLSDNTTVTFVGINSLGQISNHII